MTFVQQLVSTFEDTLKTRLDNLTKHLAKELKVDEKKLDVLIKNFNWDVMAEEAPAQPKAKEKAKEPKAPTQAKVAKEPKAPTQAKVAKEPKAPEPKKAPTKPKSKTPLPIAEKASDAKAVGKYFCVESSRSITKNPNMEAKYVFYSELGIAGIADSDKLKTALEQLDAEDASPDSKEVKAKGRTKLLPSNPDGSNPKKMKATNSRIKKNKWKMFEDASSNIVFDEECIKNGEFVAVGIQNHDTGKVMPLGPDDLKFCKANNWDTNQDANDSDADSDETLPFSDSDKDSPNKKVSDRVPSKGEEDSEETEIDVDIDSEDSD